jgi:hypothetical protein
MVLVGFGPALATLCQNGGDSRIKFKMTELLKVVNHVSLFNKKQACYKQRPTGEQDDRFKRN